MEDNRNENQENFSEESTPADENNFAYMTVLQGAKNSRLFSLLSVLASVLSILLSVFSVVALIFGALGIVFALISRKNLGYFDNISLVGLIIGIFASVFALMGIGFDILIASSEEFSRFIEALFGSTPPTGGEGNLPGNGYYV